MDELLPTDLCKICHNNSSRYRCPRCQTRTCSLPCTKRHKQWAQCSGIRDPTVYLKRSQLASPAGIDHDFNFLTSIERKIDRASRDAEERGVALHDDDPGPPRIRWKKSNLMKGEVNLKAALEKCEVIVRKAPAGMERAKQNKTVWNKKYTSCCLRFLPGADLKSRTQSLLWTVEWIHNNGRSELGRCLTSKTIAECYAHHLAQEANKKKTASTKMCPPPIPSKKRKCASTSPSSRVSTVSCEPTSLPPPQSPASAAAKYPIPPQPAEKPAETPPTANIVPTPPYSPAPASSVTLDFSPRNSPAPPSSFTLEPAPDARPPSPALAINMKPTFSRKNTTVSSNSAPEKQRLNNSAPSNTPLHFFLLHPSIPSRSRVLIPLPPEASLATHLKNKVVLEFPTIYALKYPPEKLPTGFITEDDYYKTQMKDGDFHIEKNINKVGDLMRTRNELMAPKVWQRGDGMSGQLANFVHDGADINNEEEGRVIGMDLNLDPKALMDVLTKDFSG
ncbi:hypothetical protein MMC31_000232 [Peltigera leucophlebia]|nr:hypothetical protein [Peltigera leucophlebia]